MQCLILLNSRAAGIAGGLSYETGDLHVQPGDLVEATLRNKAVEGLVIAVNEDGADEPSYALKPIRKKLSDRPLLTEAQMKTLRWMAGYYRCSLRAAAGAFLPSSEWKKLIPLPIVFYTTGASPDSKTGAKQKAILDALHLGALEEEILLDRSGASRATLKSMLERGWVLRTEQAAPSEIGDRKSIVDNAVLTDAQKTAFEDIIADERPTLIFGITGSGKTEVYAKLIERAVNSGKQALLLVPEILLTEHTIDRFSEIVPAHQMVIIHSRLSEKARRESWMRIRSGQCSVVIGSRSALFSPCPNLGLVIVDEEHEWTYKNEQTPRYHVRETAETLCQYAGATLVLGSATPSLETWHRTKTGHYNIVRLPERYAGNKVPTVRVIDLAEVKFGSVYPFSPPLLEAIQDRLEKKEQTVLFLNRRGAASSVLCLSCRRRLTSPVSQLPFTLHHDMNGKPYLLDHIGGAKANMPSRCPSCQSPELLPVGAGTQRLEDVLTKLFPSARILRADSDTLKTPEDMRELLDAMRQRKADILLGTQSVVKGLDLPGVTLAAVPVADVGLSLPHFRAGERVMQLLTQLAGRSGRAQPGEVIIQTFRPQAPEVQAAAQHQTEEWLNNELKLREQLQYPPAIQMVRFILRGPNSEARARMIHRSIVKILETQKLNGRSTVAQTLYGQNMWHVFYNGMDVRPLLQHLNTGDAIIDIDPLDVL